MKLTIKSALPDPSIAHFVHSFWMLENKTGKDIQSTLLPNAMVDMVLIKINKKWELVVRGIDTTQSEVMITSGTKMFSIGFKLLAVEYFAPRPRKKSKPIQRKTLTTERRNYLTSSILRTAPSPYKSFLKMSFGAAVKSIGISINNSGFH